MRARVGLVVVLLTGCGALVGIGDLDVDADAGAPTPDASGADAPTDAGRDAAISFDAAVVDADASAPPKTVFVTTKLFNGGLGKLPGADGLCAAEARDAGLDAGEWRAWISAEGKLAIDRIEHPGPYFLRDGRRVVADRAKLAGGTLETPISVTAKGVTATGDKLVWTGTEVDMSAASNNCGDFNTGANVSFGVMGDFDQPQMGRWTQNGGRQGVPFPAGTWDCGQNGHLYCFER